MKKLLKAKKSLNAIAAAVISVALVPACANAAVTINIIETGSDVVATASGTLDLTGLTSQGLLFTSSMISSSFGYIGTGGSFLGEAYSGFTGPAAFGPNLNYTAAYLLTGPSPFAVNGFGNGSGSPFVIVPYGSMGGNIKSSARFGNQTFASLGLTQGIYTYNSSADIVTINIGVSAAPEPATWAMMIGGFGLAGGALRNRRRKTPLTYA
jgi:hypothetical protein